MLPSYPNILQSERSVEAEFIIECVQKYCNSSTKILDVGGIPSFAEKNAHIINAIKLSNAIYKICDFRGGDYKGDFVQLDINEKFDVIIFLSSLEHFPQCTEGDMVFRTGEDRRGFLKALSLLKEDGKILLTVPFGKHVWQCYHQNYDIEGILKLTEGAKIIEQYTYTLNNDIWSVSEPSTMTEILYTDRCFGVGCFLIGKNG